MSRRIHFDGEELEAMRLTVPSLRKPGKAMTKHEAASFLGMEEETLAKWEKIGGPIWLKYAYAGLATAVCKAIGREYEIVTLPLDADSKLAAIEISRKALLARERRIRIATASAPLVP